MQPAGLAPCCLPQLNSNVRPHEQAPRTRICPPVPALPLPPVKSSSLHNKLWHPMKKLSAGHQHARFPHKVRLCLAAASMALTGCATSPELSPSAQKIQVLRQDNALSASCKRLGPLDATADQVAPASEVYKSAVNMLRNSAATVGADSLVILNSDYSTGIRNKVTVQAVALKCY